MFENIDKDTASRINVYDVWMKAYCARLSKPEIDPENCDPRGSARWAAKAAVLDFVEFYKEFRAAIESKTE